MAIIESDALRGFLSLQTFNTQILLSSVFKIGYFTNNMYRHNDLSV